MKSVYLVLAFMLGLTGIDAFANLSSGLVAHYPFDGTAVDASGNAHHGTEYGGVGYSPGILGDALTLDGLDDHVRVADALDLRMEGDFSVSLWVNLNTTDRGMVFLSKMGGLGNSVSYAQNYSIKSWSGELVSHFENPSDSDWYLRQLDVLESNKWTHVSFTREGNDFAMYMDGIVIESNTLVFTEAVGSEDLSIGVNLYSNYDFVPQNFLQGQIDEVRIYNRTLTAAEVGQLASVPEPSNLALITVISATGFFTRKFFVV